MFACSLASVLSCARFDEQEEAPVAEPKVRMTFKAEIEGDADTKTVLGGQMGDQYRKVLWEPGDSIGVINSLWYNYMEPFVNTEKEVSDVATFEGEADYGDSDYFMFYPYDKGLYCRDDDKIDFTLPSGQRYKDQSFDSGIMPMVAKGRRTERFQFQSLCGVLALNLTGSETIKSVSFSGRDASGNPIPVAGDFYVYMHYDAYPEITPREGGMTSTAVTLDCGEGIAIDPANPTPFYIVLPVGTYNEFSVVVATTDGKLMLKESKNPLTIKRANVTKTGALAYVADVAVDLSEIGHSNCYIVPKSGLYSFDADVIGNGDFGLVENANFHTKNTSIEPESAEIDWEDRPGVISGLAFDGKKVSFMSTGTEGNALVAVKDANGTILWSWHLWITDQPQEQVYVNDRGTFTMLDRNIGATRNDRGTGEEYRESMGMRYQWGRKDPFGQTASSPRGDLYDRISSQLSIAETILYPKSFVRENDPWTNEWDDNLWSSNQKTIYDPCPVGYRVPVMDVWRGFTVDGEDADRRSEINAEGSFDRGWNFIYDGSNTAWYPVSHYISYWGDFNETEQDAFYWAADSRNSDNRYYFRIYYDVYSENPDLNCQINFNQTRQASYAQVVRCMKDEGHVDISYPTVKMMSISDISSTSATIEANVTDEGITEVTERGFIWGTSEDLSPENGTKVDCGSGSGKFTATLEGLAHSTRYYVMAYATNGRGTSYSDIRSFYTPYEGNAVNLSKDGTANCYIVPPVYSEYVFNASVKGNSDESVGSIASVEVLWETRNDRNTINVGDVIDPESVVLEGNNVHFKLPFEPKPGNALIAVKDDLGTILWSWHIWVVDFDPVETQCKYISGAVMMDRNLGSLNVIPGDLGSFGLMYQWGRKDPFVGIGITWDDGWQRAYTAPSEAISYQYYDSSTDTIENAVKNPTVVYNDARWNEATDLWGYKKTKYDPCPAGWRVSERSVWEGIVKSGDIHAEYITIPEPYSIPETYIPTVGYSDGSEHIDNLSYSAYFWMATRGDNIEMDSQSDYYFYNREVDWMYSVRCMKDAGTGKPGNGDDYIVDDEYEW